MAGMDKLILFSAEKEQAIDPQQLNCLFKGLYLVKEARTKRLLMV